MGPRLLENFNIVTRSYFSPNLVLKGFLMRGPGAGKQSGLKKLKDPLKILT